MNAEEYEKSRRAALKRLETHLNRRRELSNLPDAARNIPRLDLAGLTPNEWLELARQGLLL